MKKEILKAVSVILTVCCMLFIFTACSQINIQTNSNSELTSESEATANETVADNTKETETIELKSAEDYVTTEREYNVTYDGKFYITGEKSGTNNQAKCRLPQLSVDSEDAESINNDIHEEYDKVFDDIETYYQDYEMNRTDYVAYLNGNILSLVIETRTTNTPNSFFKVYNIDVKTGKELNNEDVVNLSNISLNEAYGQLYSKIESIYTDEQKELVDAETYESIKGKSLDDKNIQESMFYYNENGSLMAAYRYYWFAGAENYGDIFELSAKCKNA